MSTRMVGLAIFVALAGAAIGQTRPGLPKPDETAQSTVGRALGSEIFSPDLQNLMVSQRRVSAAGESLSAKLLAPYGVTSDSDDPVISVFVTTRERFDASTLSLVSGALVESMGFGYVVTARLSALGALARLPGVDAVRAMKAREIPVAKPARVTAPRVSQPTTLSRGMANEGETGLTWSRQGMTGKGAIVAVLDTGIDWKHPEFVNADGTSRILFLYDMGDSTWTKSSGKTGTKPPVNGDDGTPLGTLYTKAQINAALKGTGTVNSKDNIGHGTACASVAAGKNPMLAGGLATGADLIVVKVTVPTSGGEAFSERYPMAAKWVADEAKKLNRPVVMNMSFGSQHSFHDGKDAEELFLDALVADNPGVAICVAAGNEGRDAFHARGRFGPARPGQEDVDGDSIEMFVTDIWEDGVLNAVFKKSDDWGLIFVPRVPVFYDEDDEEVDAYFYMFKKDGKYFHGAKIYGVDKTPKWLLEQVGEMYTIAESGEDEIVEVWLPMAGYDVWGFGASDKVTDGSYSLYAPFTYDITFGKGGSSEYMVGSPANADRVIAVGSYVFRNAWDNADGGKTRFNLPLGSMSSYSSPGPRRDGMVKPDIVAPGQYMFSALAAGSQMGMDSDGAPKVLFLAPDGLRLAWSGTSASTPFVAGVIALMFEKNPKLTTAQIRQILISTATEDGQTGGVPNPYWGNGKLNPEGAIRAVTAAEEESPPQPAKG